MDGAYQEHTFTINSNKQIVKIALTWINYKYIDRDDHSTGYPDSTYTMPDLDLRIYDSNGNQVGGSFAAKGNLEISQIQDLPAGTYKIEIMAYTGSDKAINYSVAWWY